MNIKPIRTKADHAAALAEIERLWNARPGSKDADRLDVLATLVDAYERAHTPIFPPDPVAAIEFRLEQQGKTRKDLEGVLGTRARVSEILRGRRALTLPMIRRLHHALEIPLETLVLEHQPSPRGKGRPSAKRGANRGVRSRTPSQSRIEVVPKG